MSSNNPLSLSSSEDPRTQTLVTRMTPLEIASIEAVTQACGRNRSQWLRDAALAHLRVGIDPRIPEAETAIMQEVRGLRYLLLNLFPAAIPTLDIRVVREIMAFADAKKRENPALSK